MARSPRNTKSSSRSPWPALLGVAALIVVGVFAYQTFASDATATAPVDLELAPSELSQVQGIAIGPEDAPVVMYEFADFQCPGCGQFATFVTPLIKERLVEPGLVRYVYYDFPLQMHSHAFLAARAARCADEQGDFWTYHDLLYARQPTWSAMSSATDYFVELANEAGLNESEFEACLRSDRYAEEVTRSLRLGESLGVQGTPTLFINGKRLPQVPSFSELERIVREEAGQSAGQAADTDSTAAAS